MLRLRISLCLLLAVSVAGSLAISGTVYYSNDTREYVFQAGIEDKEYGAAYGHYEDALNETGWGVLNVAAGYATKASHTDEQLMMAAGVLEGALTQREIYNTFWNLYNDSFKGESPETVDKVKAFYHQQRVWMEDMIVAHANSSSYWYYTKLIYAQFLGLFLGYGLLAPIPHLDEFAFDFLCGQGDFLDIQNFLFPDQRPDYSTLSEREYHRLLYKGHCSALIKILPGYENVFGSHSSWFTYAAMNRIYKHYAFSLSSQQPATKVMSFSSYPGFLSSLDDFYIMDSGVVMLQTTNGVFNKTLYDQATPNALLAWHRVRLANWLAAGGKEWADYVSQYNSGTYNNQYMVLDLKQIELEKEVHDDALWVVEQIPGYVESGDQTPILREGYWPSYNIPFYEDIYNLTGYAAMAAKYGSNMSYELCPRAKIFRRDQGKVHDLESMEYLMRYNDYQNDPYSEGNPMNTICSRGDLLDPPEGGGCYDTKVTDYHMAQSLTAYAENGPTHQGLSPFDWQNSGLTTPHEGQPSLFNFSFVKMTPTVP